MAMKTAFLASDLAKSLAKEVALSAQLGSVNTNNPETVFTSFLDKAMINSEFRRRTPQLLVMRLLA